MQVQLLKKNLELYDQLLKGSWKHEVCFEPVIFLKNASKLLFDVIQYCKYLHVNMKNPIPSVMVLFCSSVPLSHGFPRMNNTRTPELNQSVIYYLYFSPVATFWFYHYKLCIYPTVKIITFNLITQHLILLKTIKICETEWKNIQSYWWLQLVSCIATTFENNREGSMSSFVLNSNVLNSDNLSSVYHNNWFLSYVVKVWNFSFNSRV